MQRAMVRSEHDDRSGLSKAGPHIDLNADMGEYADPQAANIEAAIMALITSCNIACGGHAGSEETMRRTMHLAVLHGVRCGAHPSFPDREGFGRRAISMEHPALLASLEHQVDALVDIAKQVGTKIGHLKPHGALYNEAAQNIELARMIAALARSKALALVGPPGSAVETAALQIGVEFVGEGFVDRTYQINGALVARTAPGALISDIDARTKQALSLAKGEALQLATGRLTLSVKTLCIHSDSPGAVEMAQAIRRALEESAITIRRWDTQSAI